MFDGTPVYAQMNQMIYEVYAVLRFKHGLGATTLLAVEQTGARRVIGADWLAFEGLGQRPTRQIKVNQGC
jgi:hypothetical protein